MSTMPTYPLRVLALRLRKKHDDSGSDTWILVSEQHPSDRYLTAVLWPDEPYVQWLPDQEEADAYVSEWVANLTVGPTANYEFVGAEEKHISVAGLTDNGFEQRWWALALRANLNGELFNKFHPARGRGFGKTRAFREDDGRFTPGSSFKGGTVYRKQPPRPWDSDEYVIIEDLLS